MVKKRKDREEEIDKKVIGRIFLSILIIVLALIVSYYLFDFTGRVVEEGVGKIVAEGFGGPSVEDSECLYECVEVENNSEDVCMEKCGVELQPTDVGEGEACMQDCILIGCEEKDIACQNANVEECEKSCGMVTEPEAQDKEEQCIMDCVAQHEKPGEPIICSSGSYYGEGETGGSVCQMCADQCKHLYAGPCLTDEKYREKEAECDALGEHVDGEPVYGPSGEGYECVIDLECVDYSSEFGDNPGKGPGIGQEGYVAPNPVAGVIDGAIKFFKGIFSGEEKIGGDVSEEDLENFSK